MRKSHARNQYKLSKGLEGAVVNPRWSHARHIAGRSINWNKRSRGTRNAGSTYLLTTVLGQRRIQLVSHFFVPLCVSVCICDVNAFVGIFQELFLQSEISLPQQRECSYCCCFPSWILSIIEWNETLQWIAWVCIRSTWRWRTSSVSWSTTEELSTATSWGSMPEFKPTFLLTRKGSSYLSTTGPMIPSRFMKPRSITQVHMRWWQWLWLWWLW